MFFLRVKPMNNSEEMCGGFDGLHTAAVTDVSNVMSAGDDMSIRDLSRGFFVCLFLQSFAKENDTATSQSST